MAAIQHGNVLRVAVRRTNCKKFKNVHCIEEERGERGATNLTDWRRNLVDGRGKPFPVTSFLLIFTANRRAGIVDMLLFISLMYRIRTQFLCGSEEKMFGFLAVLSICK